MALPMRFLLVVLIVLLLAPSYDGRSRRKRFTGDAPLWLTPVALDSADPARRRVGALRYLEGYALSSNDPAFGGFSGMAVAGDRITLMSDYGTLMRFWLGRDGQAHELSFGELPSGPGTGWTRQDRDSESLTIDPASGRAWVGFENDQEIWRYAPGFVRAEGFARPATMLRWGANSGPESITRLSDGRFLVIRENYPKRPEYNDVQALVFAGDPVRVREERFEFRIRLPGGLRPTDAAQLPDGRLLVLARQHRFPLIFESALLLVDLAGARPGAIVPARAIARLVPPLIHDNFEAMALVREGGDTLVWLASDNNLGVGQRTLLLKFRIEIGALPR